MSAHSNKLNAVCHVGLLYAAVLGIWSGNACFGNIVGTALVALMFELFDKTVAWKVALVVAAVLVTLHGVVIFFFLVPDPKLAPYRHAALEDAKPEVAKSPSGGKDDAEMETGTSAKRDEKGISFFEAWCIPGVRMDRYALSCWVTTILRTGLLLRVNLR